MMNLGEFIDELSALGITLVAEGDQLRIRARQGVLTQDLRNKIAERKSALVALLRSHRAAVSDSAVPVIVHDAKNRYEPFSLTDIQHAYWIGRGDLMELGNTAVHAYLEIEQDDFDISRLTSALNALIQRHDMLRMIIDPSGEQRVLKTVPEYRIEVAEFTSCDVDASKTHLEATRSSMSHQILAVDKWPLFDIRATKYGKNRVRLHISLDILMADLWSLFRFFSEWRLLYDSSGSELAPLEITFRDYIHAEKSLEDTPSYQSSRSYWIDRLDNLHPAPDLPLAKQPAAITRPHFVRRSHVLDNVVWEKLCKKARGEQVTPSGLLLSVFAEVLAAWSKSPRFTLNLTLFNRLPMHPQVNSLIGDFTTTILLSIDGAGSGGFWEHAHRIQDRMYADLEHRVYNGVRVLRDLSQRRPGMPGAAMPVVFSSALGLGAMDSEFAVATQLGGQMGEVVYTITQTPQVWIDHQVFENDGELRFNWDVVDELFPEGMIDAMFETYCGLLQQLAIDDEVPVSGNILSLPVSQLESRILANDTAAPLADALLHDLVLDSARRNPESEAVVDSRRRMTYAELAKECGSCAHLLHALGVRPNTLVAVVLDKGWEQIVAVLGVQSAGAAYLPVDPGLPTTRRNHLLAHGEVTVVVTCNDYRERLKWPEGITLVCVDDIAIAAAEDEGAVVKPDTTDLAYVIYTSGSTGTPKGVAIEHRAAVNTVLDINKRFGVSSRDTVLAVSALGFDLSVYDIFGVLAAGGKVVIPDSADSKDVAHWWDLVKKEHITVWNSVPLLFQMLVDHLHISGKGTACDLRLALLSGDWVPLNLPDRARTLWTDLQVISLGGATEASIWSVFYLVQSLDPEWRSVPYGMPLANQHLHVFDEAMRPSPIWVPGHLYIGGAGLAREYWRDEGKTSASFITHPVTGDRLYRTGDLGRYLPDGNIEFLGRADYQVKINGYRIELGEIESVLRGYPGVKDAVVSALGEIRGEKRLVAYVVLHRSSEDDRGDRPDRHISAEDETSMIKQYLSERLPAYMVPVFYVTLDRFPLTRNGKVDRNSLPEPERVVSKSTTGSVPRSQDEERIARLFAGTLKLEMVGIHDSFFELGGDSLLATRLVASIGRTFEVELHLRDLFNGPTVAELSRRITEIRRSRNTGNAVREQDLVALEEEGEL